MSITDENIDGFDNIGKVYLVWWDNGEPYEDGFRDVDCVFSSREAAEKYLDNNFVRKPKRIYNKTTHKYEDGYHWIPKKHECSKGYESCYDCPIYTKYEAVHTWSEPLDDYCEEYEYVMDSEYENEFYYIEEVNLYSEK